LNSSLEEKNVRILIIFILPVKTTYKLNILLKLVSPFCLLFFGWIDTTGVLVRQALYHLSLTPALFALCFFPLGTHKFAWDPPQATILQTMASHVAGMIGACHHARLVG
jgi:hypothetical protein